MKSTIQLLLTSVFILFTYTSVNISNSNKTIAIADFNDSGYLFDVNVTKINSEYSEIPSAVFRNKLVIVSSKKIGAIGNGTDEYTKLPYTNLFCSDLANNNKDFSTPILFSRMLNSRGNEGQVSFSPDQHTIYYTKSKRRNSNNFQLYVAQLEKDSYGKWKNHRPMTFNSEDYSVENPHVSSDGNFLYFSSNMEGGLGGFDIYRAQISEDGSLGTPINLGPTVNTDLDEKYPHTSKDGDELFFSSTGHNGQGGYDIFIANNYGELNYSQPRNLGIKINSIRDDIAYTLIDEDNGVYSSNAGNTGQRFNMYKFNARAIYQDLEGVIFEENNEIIANITVVLYDNKGNEIERQTTGKDATYRFKIRPFEQYQIKTLKNGYENAVVTFQSMESKLNIAYKEDLKLSSNGTLTKK
ncbi:TolB family protein [Winogradskyella sp. PE311]|uniref:TolB family protein n=1 Tax=Winogradskyella sp. PE311 TaxID=3366943 RepID=UPI00397F0778